METTAAIASPASLPPSTARPLGEVLWRSPRWMWAGAAALLVYSPAAFAGRISEPWIGVAFITRLVLEGAALVWAGRHPALPPRIRLAFTIAGWTSVASAVTNVSDAVAAAGGPQVLPDAVVRAYYVLSYAAGLAAMVVYPRTDARRGDLATFALDTAAAAGGMAMLMWTFVTWPIATAHPGSIQADVVADGLAAFATLVGLNLVVVRGARLPSRRAFWWFLAGQATYLPTTVFLQFERPLAATRWADTSYLLGALVVMIGAVVAREDAAAPAPSGRTAKREALNPLPIFVALATAASLLLALTVGPVARALPLGISLLGLTIVLATRLVLSLRENARLLAEEAAERHRRQTEKTEAIGRLAGGIAHEFNNILTTVIGHADLGAMDPATPGHARDAFTAISAAGDRAAALTRQLLQYSGQHIDERGEIDPGALIGSMAGELTSKYQARLTVTLTHDLLVVADPRRIGQVVVELVDQAMLRTSRERSVHVEVARAVLTAPLDSAVLVAGPGEYARLSVRDNGRALSTSELSHLFDPFFASAPGALAGSLGMAAAYGIVASHRGGLTATSDATGTTVSIYLPLATRP